MYNACLQLSVPSLCLNESLIHTCLCANLLSSAIHFSRLIIPGCSLLTSARSDFGPSAPNHRNMAPKLDSAHIMSHAKELNVVGGVPPVTFFKVASKYARVNSFPGRPRSPVLVALRLDQRLGANPSNIPCRNQLQRSPPHAVPPHGIEHPFRKPRHDVLVKPRRPQDCPRILFFTSTSCCWAVRSRK